MNTYFLSVQERDRIIEHLTVQAEAAFKEILANHKIDLGTNLRRPASKLATRAVWMEAGKRLTLAVFEQRRPLEAAELREIWHRIVADFYQTEGWQEEIQTRLAEMETAEPQEHREDFEIRRERASQIAREMWPYLLLFVFGAIFLKGLILYLGAHGYFFGADN